MHLPQLQNDYRDNRDEESDVTLSTKRKGEGLERRWKNIKLQLCLQLLINLVTLRRNNLFWDSKRTIEAITSGGIQYKFLILHKKAEMGSISLYNTLLSSVNLIQVIFSVLFLIILWWSCGICGQFLSCSTVFPTSHCLFLAKWITPRTKLHRQQCSEAWFKVWLLYIRVRQRNTQIGRRRAT